MSFNNKVVIVTGSSTGIGAVTAVAFAKEGAKVVIVGRNEGKLKDVAKQCSAVGSAPLVIKADVTKDEDAKKIINDTIQKFGQLDVLVNNAGIFEYGDILSGKILETYDRIIAINLRAVIHLTQLAAPHLVKTKGSIVNISSAAAQMYGPPNTVAYNVSKAALDHFTKGSALELAPSGVRVNAVSPGPVETDMMTRHSSEMGVTVQDIEAAAPLKRASQSEEIADLVLFVAGDKAKGITGSVYLADNGFCLL
ncbi:hypothetical protein ABMA27_014564 [Loxostege sticticalis]|uniref:Ketoreductase domain-containing protein n=1 Tax=Loxostege sticticalis TaxID=481309 RepID=A0ABR3I9C5_LOXSC